MIILPLWGFWCFFLANKVKVNLLKRLSKLFVICSTHHAISSWTVKQKNCPIFFKSQFVNSWCYLTKSSFSNSIKSVLPEIYYPAKTVSAINKLSYKLISRRIILMTVSLGQSDCQAFTLQENIELMAEICSILCLKNSCSCICK